MMYNLKDFLTRYTHITPPDGAVKQALRNALETITKTHVPKETIRVIRNIAYLETDSAIKNRVFTKKQEVLRCVNEALGGRETLKDIK